jgi:hypothetical protein
VPIRGRPADSLLLGNDAPFSSLPIDAGWPL